MIPPSPSDRPEILILTRASCGLCEEAAELFLSLGLEPRRVDIDTDPVLRARYTDCVPVVFVDGRLRFRGRVDPRLLSRLLRGLAR
ncbi:MAG: glutaredoxin family protein [Pirellulales bacterium]|nr:glutaredoxin family protein [Pirellulales bacterium]